jgi:hypothetical protein
VRHELDMLTVNSFSRFGRQTATADRAMYWSQAHSHALTPLQHTRWLCSSRTKLGQPGRCWAKQAQPCTISWPHLGQTISPRELGR